MATLSTQPLIDAATGGTACRVVVESGTEGVTLTFPSQEGSRVEVRLVGGKVRVCVWRGRSSHPDYYGAVAPAE